MHGGTRRVGRFITFEGLDGAGKSEQASRLARRLAVQGMETVLTREPGGTSLGEGIRALLLDRTVDRTPITDALLFNAARAELVTRVIRPALERGATVVCDRFTDSTVAYQGYGAGADLGRIEALAVLATGGLRPDLTILLDLPAEMGLARRHSGAADQLTRFEAADLHDPAFHDRVRRGFRALAAAEPARWQVVDAAGTPDEVEERVARTVEGTFAGSEPRMPFARIP